MKALVLKENLTRALSVIGRNISTKPQIPILANVLLKGKEGKLILAATNLETGVSLSIGAKIDEEGEISVPARLFSEFITSISGDKIELTSLEGKLEVKAGKGKGQFAGIDAKEFPPFPATDGQEKRMFKLETINGSISRSSFAAATDEGRPVLTGIRINLSTGKISFAATDGYRLSLEEVVLSEEKEELQIIIPAKSMQEMIRIAQDLKSEEIGLVLLKEKKQAVFFLTNCILYTRLIDGEFPKIEKIIPAMFKTKITIDKEEFAQNVKSTSIFARGGAKIFA
ncbi:MAG: polymerase III subunit beta protein [Candidatus Gottesmanbacteria bacterium GW2011_GWA2_41_12]|uniref:Polymerase III subunit beta protein n=1 Tax=Candidatus Gottesmanbacteria bacterium GW2011_GWA2_41_12 TaxID=1618440 RepID=A0A0G0UHQ6_9BACT|nr:MAG: polymerase III subunit beta protein [Candidatus Gottesmanbacteria bacterium GW2011_GWA2_41_12]